MSARRLVPGQRVGGGPPASEVVPFHLDLSAQRAARRVEEIQQSLAAIPDGADDGRAALLAVLAVAQSLIDPGQARRTLAAARRLAGCSGSRQARTYTLMARFAIDLSPHALPERTALSAEALELLSADDCAPLRQRLLPMAYFMRLGALMESGNIRAVDEALSPELHVADSLTDVLNSRYAVWFRCARACMDGQLTLAERLADDGHAMAVDAGDVDAEYVWAGQVAIIRWMQGRVSEMEPVFLRARQADPGEPVWAAAVAWIWAHQGRAAAARGLVESLPDVDEMPRGRNWLATMSMLAEVVAEVGSDDLVERLRRLLEPFADRVVPVGLGIICWGTVARPLALLARRQRRLDEAHRRYSDAIDLCSRIGAQAWLAQAQVELAALMLEQGRTSLARRLADESVAAARHLGLRAVEQRADRLLGRVELAVPGHPTPGADTPRRGRAGGVDERELPMPPDEPVVPLILPAARVMPAHVSATDSPVGTTSALPSTLPALGDAGPQTASAAPRIIVLGGFAVVSLTGSPVGWRSRKARTLLKILLARRGAALARESAMDLLWPGEDPHRLRNRFAVAMTAVRKALDPERRHAPGAFLVANDEVLRLRVDRLSIDVEDFLTLAESALVSPVDDAGPAARMSLLRSAVTAYRGDAFADDPYAAWAEQLRRQAHLAFFAVSHALADAVGEQGDHLQRVHLYRGILAIDPYDLPAHDGLIEALTALRATSHLAAARRDRHRRMSELGIDDGPGDRPGR